MPLIAVWQSNPTGSHVLWTHQLKLATLTGLMVALPRAPTLWVMLRMI